MGFRSGEFSGQSSTPTPWSYNQLLVLLPVWAGAKSCWKKKSVYDLHVQPIMPPHHEIQGLLQQDVIMITTLKK